MSPLQVVALVVGGILAAYFVTGWIALRNAPRECGHLAPDGSRTCELEQDHPGPHGDGGGFLWSR